MSFQVGRSAKSFLMRQHLSRDLKEVREQIMRMSEGRVLQAKRMAGAKILGWKCTCWLVEQKSLVAGKQ